MNFKSVTNKDWKIALADKNKILYLKEKFGLGEILSKLLVIKNINFDDINFFLNPKINNDLINLNSLTDMQKSVEHIFQDILNYKTLGIFGDYDVDGAASTALLIKFFEHIGHPFKFYIPNRVTEGYGPSIKAFEKLMKNDLSTIITVDCGTLSYKSIDYANLNKVNIIVIDHHQAEPNLPKAFSIINPNRIDDSSNFKMLCATSLTFLFLLGLDKKLKNKNWYKLKNISPPILSNYLDLVALATICDVVPLTGINRYFVKEGLNKLKEKKNIGLKYISEICEINSEPNTYHLGFIYGPRINAGGRLGFSSYGAKLLSTNKSNEAKDLSLILNKLNYDRKNIENKYLNSIFKIADKKKNDSVLVIYKNNFHEGVIGILASRIKDRYNKPTIILSGVGNILKGSARSIFNFDIGVEILNLVKKKILIKGGGHKMAAGFTVEKNKVEKLNTYLNSAFLKKMKKKFINDVLLIDAVISPNALNLNFYDEVNKLSPFGNGNSEPKFVIENLKILKSKILQNKHISVILQSKNGKSIKGICFNSVNTLLEQYLTNNKKNYVNVAGKLSLNKWNGKNQIEFIIFDISVN